MLLFDDQIMTEWVKIQIKKNFQNHEPNPGPGTVLL